MKNRTMILALLSAAFAMGCDKPETAEAAQEMKA